LVQVPAVVLTVLVPPAAHCGRELPPLELPFPPPPPLGLLEQAKVKVPTPTAAITTAKANAFRLDEVIVSPCLEGTTVV
jgi:hypothetical protein